MRGVTGSGKTEVYLRAASAVIDAGRRVLVLVPEIGLTPVVAGLFHARFGRRVAIQHSGLSDGERHDQWHRIRRGDVEVVVGTRSAVFAPLENVGLIVVDEEHDGAYKQDEAPRYHGRDVAIVRARLEQAVALLGSATPSLESAANAQRGRYGSLVLPTRIFDRPMACVEIVDMRKEYAAHGADVILSETLTSRLEARLEKGEQSVLLLNRRGFATVIFCRQCGASLECPHCSVALTFHRAARRVRCHYCNYSAAVPKALRRLRRRISRAVRLRHRADRARGARAVSRTRASRASIATRFAAAAPGAVLRDVARGAIDIVVGTQMIAKGTIFRPSRWPASSARTSASASRISARPSARSSCSRRSSAARAAARRRARRSCRRCIPSHYSIRAAAAQDFEAFFEREMEFRESMQYPPATSLINVFVKGSTLDRAMADALDLVARVRRAGPHGRVIGPAPAAMSKIKDEYRAQFFVKGTRRGAMREAIQRALADRADLKRRVVVDVDPMSVI